MADSDKITTTFEEIIVAEGGTLIIADVNPIINRQIKVLEVTTGGTITACTGFVNGIAVNFLTDSRYGWTTVVANDRLFAGKNAYIKNITLGVSTRVLAHS